MNKLVLIVLFFFVSCFPGLSEEQPRFLTMNGYVSSMQSMMFDSLSGSFINENLIHNRVNLKGYINENISFATEFRNRLYTGDMIKAVPSYSDMIGTDPGWIDLSWNILNEKSFFLNTTIDRIWVDFNYGKFQGRVGRQRINWGQTLVWNPNDIFNAYSFFDFDYEEKPGSDAIRLQYYPGYSSAIELALKADYNDRITAASLYRFNKWGYDIQFLAGYFESEDLMLGTGWSGAFGSVSFRGEASWFRPVHNFRNRIGTGIFTIGFDKTFKNNTLVQGQLMYCNNPVKTNSFTSYYYGNISAKELAFSEFSLFGLASYPVTPLFNTSLSAMWLPEMKGYYAGPSFDYSLSDNIDFSIYWQHFDSKRSILRERINMVFLRVKLSF